MFDAKKLIDQLLGSQMPGGSGSVKDLGGAALQKAKDNPLATGALAAVLLGTGTGRSIAGSALKLGGLAAIAGLGYQAYRNYQAGRSPLDFGTAPASPAPGQPQAPAEPLVLPAPAGSGFEPEVTAASNDFALRLVQVMIAAARADGHIDAAERANIMDKVRAAALDHEAEAFLERELAAPLDLDGLVSAARTEEQRVELYTAARLAITADSRAERGFLDLLAGRLNLPDALVDHIEATVSAAKV